jgi:heat shock protein HslJ
MAQLMTLFAIVLLPLLLIHTGADSPKKYTRTNNTDKVVQIDLHPVSSHIRRLESQLQQIENEMNSGSHHLRHLKVNEKNALQYQLQAAIDALEGQSAAYASLLQFPDGLAQDETYVYGNRHLKEHNNNIQKYNELYRQFSRYEWALRRELQAAHGDENRLLEQDGAYFLFPKEEEASLKERAGTSTSSTTRQIDIPSALFETNWQATQIPFDNVTEAPQYDITLSIDGETVTGETGCNLYRSSIRFYPNNILEVGYLATTRMACEPDRTEQEGRYVRFIEHVKFGWRVDNGVLILSVVGGDDVAQFEEIPFVRDIDDPSAAADASTTTTEGTSTTVAISTTRSSVNDWKFSLVGSEWQATQIGYKKNDRIQLKPVLKEHPVTLLFDSEGRIGGQSGCNSYGGELLNLTDSVITVGPIMSTLMFCFDDGIMEQEMAFSSVFQQESLFYEVVDGNETSLVLQQLLNVDGDVIEGDVVATLVLLANPGRSRKLQSEQQDIRQSAPTDVDMDIEIIGTEWTATEFASVNGTTLEMNPILQDYPITIGFESVTKLYGSTGCNNYFSFQAIISGSRVDVGGIASTRMICPEERVMDQENKYINLLHDRSFFYKVMTGSDEVDELVLSEVLAGGANEVEGQVLARFVRSHSPSTELAGMMERELIEGRIEIKKKGGMFNAYQTTPVHQGYGTHFATMWVGTPPQRKSVIIDTGSHYTAFPCKGCTNCGEDHHTDPYFDPDASSTFHALTCTECQSASCLKGKCVFSQSCK